MPLLPKNVLTILEISMWHEHFFWKPLKEKCWLKPSPQLLFKTHSCLYRAQNSQTKLIIFRNWRRYVNHGLTDNSPSNFLWICNYFQNHLKKCLRSRQQLSRQSPCVREFNNLWIYAYSKVIFRYINLLYDLHLECTPVFHLECNSSNTESFQEYLKPIVAPTFWSNIFQNSTFISPFVCFRCEWVWTILLALLYETCTPDLY